METQTVAEPIRASNYRFLQEHVYSNSGIVVGDDKTYLFESRLMPIVRQLGLGSINDLCALIQEKRDAEVGHRVVEAITTNETYFFRDPSHYDAIRTALLPRRRAEKGDVRRLRFWSAAASTGQEAYSLAILLREEGFGDWFIRILGTDLSSQVVDRARAGRYHQIEMNRGLPAPLLVKYFRRAGLEWQLSDDVRRMVEFQTFDLRRPMQSMGPFDLVFCRNVLIYFDTPTKMEILRQIRDTLLPGGWLLLGGTEPTLGVEQWFDRESVGNTTVLVAR
jgi:chemotaxis protein methyltransferase CheR